MTKVAAHKMPIYAGHQDEPLHTESHLATPHVTTHITHPELPHMTPTLHDIKDYATQHYEQHGEEHENHFHSYEEDYFHSHEDYHHVGHQHTCWRQVTARHAGYYPTCGQKGEQDGQYCYERCENGFTGDGPVCF